MRTPGERTSGAWTGGCVIHPDGGDETDRTAGNSYTATPHNTQLMLDSVCVISAGQVLCFCQIEFFKYCMRDFLLVSCCLFLIDDFLNLIDHAFGFRSG